LERLVKKLGEPKLIMLSLVLTGLALCPLPYIRGDAVLSWTGVFHSNGWPWLKLILVLTLLAIGSNLTRPPLFGMLSYLTSEHEQGATIGVAQGSGSLARILGPIFATALYAPKFLSNSAASTPSSSAPLAHPGALPYLTCGVLAIVTGMVALRRLNAAPPGDSAKPAHSQPNQAAA